jgi:hypothetical protein
MQPDGQSGAMKIKFSNLAQLDDLLHILREEE